MPGTELAKAWRLLGFVHGSVCQYGEAAAAVKEPRNTHVTRTISGSRRGTSTLHKGSEFGPTPAQEAIEHCEHSLGEGLSDRQARR